MPLVRRRGSLLTFVQDIAHLEQKVSGLENQLRRLSTTTSTSSEGQDDKQSTQESPSWQQQSRLSSARTDSAVSMQMEGSHIPDFIYRTNPHWSSNDLVETLGLSPEDADFRNSNNVSIYRGRTTGVEILRSLRNLCDSFAGLPIDHDHGGSEIVSALDYSIPSGNIPLVTSANSFFSAEGLLYRWINLAFDEAFILWPIIDRDSFNAYVKRLIEHGGPDFVDGGEDQFGLFHAVIALGQRHDPDLLTPEGNRSQSTETRG